MKRIEEDEVAPSRTLLARERKQELARQHDIKCGYCRYHRGENRAHVSPHANPRKKGKRRRGE